MIEHRTEQQSLPDVLRTILKSSLINCFSESSYCYEDWRDDLYLHVIGSKLVTWSNSQYLIGQTHRLNLDEYQLLYCELWYDFNIEHCLWVDIRDNVQQVDISDVVWKCFRCFLMRCGSVMFRRPNHPIKTNNELTWPTDSQSASGYKSTTPSHTVVVVTTWITKLCTLTCYLTNINSHTATDGTPI